MKYELKNSGQAEYKNDICGIIKNFKLALVYIFILVFSLSGVLSSFAGSPDPENTSSSACSSDSSSTTSGSLSDLTGFGSSEPSSDSFSSITLTDSSSTSSNSPSQEK